MAGRIYSVGYEGFDAEALVQRLAAVHVSLVIDVRLNAISRKRGLSKRALAASLEDAGIGYVHEPALGNPSDNRDSFRRGDGTEGRTRMRRILTDESGPALERLVEHARAADIAVLCVERDPTRCHRDVITAMAQEADPTIEVVPIL